MKHQCIVPPPPFPQRKILYETLSIISKLNINLPQSPNLDFPELGNFVVIISKSSFHLHPDPVTGAGQKPKVWTHSITGVHYYNNNEKGKRLLTHA